MTSKTQRFWISQINEKLLNKDEENITNALKSLGWKRGGSGILQGEDGKHYDILFTKKTT